MALRIPSINSPQWEIQDFLYLEEIPDEYRYLQIKWSKVPFTQVSETFDYSNPPVPLGERSGGPVSGQIDYLRTGQLITIYGWSVNWRDEWPLRIAVNHLVNCLYPRQRGFILRVEADPAHAFWVSQEFIPGVDPHDGYLYYPPSNPFNVLHGV